MHENFSDNNSFWPEKPHLDTRKALIGDSYFTILSYILVCFLCFELAKGSFDVLVILISVIITYELSRFGLLYLSKLPNWGLYFLPVLFRELEKQLNVKKAFLTIFIVPFVFMIVGGFLLVSAGENRVQGLFGFFLSLLSATKLLPFLNLDGARLLDLVFPDKAVFFRMLLNILLSVSLIFFGFLIQEYSLMFIGFFMVFGIKKRYQIFLIRKELKEANIPFAFNYAQLPNQVFAKIRSKVIDYSKSLQIISDEIERDEVKEQIALEVNRILIPPYSNSMKGMEVLFFVGFWLLSIFGFVYFFKLMM